MQERSETMENTEIFPMPSHLPPFSRFWIWLLSFFFRKIKFYKKNVALIQKYLKKGAIVHVIQYENYMDYLILNFFFKVHDLPPVLLPEKSWFQRVLDALTGRGRADGGFRRVPDKNTKTGQQFILFLQRGGSFLSVRARKEIDAIQELVELQKDLETPLYLMPQAFLWSRRPVSMIRTLRDVLFGNALNPGRFRRFVILVRHCRTAFVRSGQPLKLQDWTSEIFGEHGMNAVKEIRWRLFKFLSEERMAVTGPMSRPRTWILESVLNSENVVSVMKEIAEEEGKPIEKIQERAARQLDYLAADYKYSFIWMASTTLANTMEVMYDPVLTDREGMERLREYLKEGSVVYVPSHKSHLDYLAWSHLLHVEGLVPPHIIAGENLAFWPMGYLFRRMGAIFIRRSFKNDRLYSTILRQYLARMFQEGYSQEFFIEGTRSRTGKLLAPKFGILSVYVDAFLNNPSRDIRFVPISIIYSRLVEEGSHTKELTGGEKAKESTSSLLKVFGVLRLRYGAMYQQMGKLISLREFCERQGYDPQNITERERRGLVESLGYEIIHHINKATVVTPTSVVALAMLAASRKGVAKVKLMEHSAKILDFVKEIGAPVSPLLDNWEASIQEAVDLFLKEESLEEHRIGSETVYVLNENGRRALDFYKNNILHSFFIVSLIALAFRTFKSSEARMEDLRKRIDFLFGLFKEEIVYPHHFDVERDLEKAFDYLGKHDILVREGDVLKIGKLADLYVAFFSRMFSNFLESYWLVALGLSHLVGKRMNQKKLMKLLLEEGKKMSLIGELTRDEAFSKNNFLNALTYFINRGVLIKHEAFVDTTVTVLPRDLRSDPKKLKKAGSKRKTDLELSEAFNSTEALEEIAKEIRFYLDGEGSMF